MTMRFPFQELPALDSSEKRFILHHAIVTGYYYILTPSVRLSLGAHLFRSISSIISWSFVKFCILLSAMSGTGLLMVKIRPF